MSVGDIISPAPTGIASIFVNVLLSRLTSNADGGLTITFANKAEPDTVKLVVAVDAEDGVPYKEDTDDGLLLIFITCAVAIFTVNKNNRIK
jgi:hypothetical protein